MGDKTGISWTDSTWNPVTGCSKVSQGCAHCYAERVFPRAYGKDRKFTDVRTHPERLDQPLRWRKARKIFVNSMSDLFHEAVPFEFIHRVFAVMAISNQHSFQVLTKRPERMRDYITELSKSINPIEAAAREMGHAFVFQGYSTLRWPIPNVWLGVSVEDQQTFDQRVVRLLTTAAAIRFVSYEPALSAVDFKLDCTLPKLDWIIAGGESGPKARPSELSWFQSARQQCLDTKTAFWMKQLGGHPNPRAELADFPEDLRCQQFPR